jgi:hypothetical protein
MYRGLLHVGTVFSSALLLFLVQPMMGKLLLPWFGGSAGVWTTAMLFFQAMLLLGYVYAWLLARLPSKAQIAIHVMFLAASCLAMPLAPWRNAPAPGDPPTAIAILLLSTIGLPFFLLASTSPLIQAWREQRKHDERVYRLFALSNLASLAALLLYPFAIEPRSTVRRQLFLWSMGYACFVLLSAMATITSRGGAVAVVPHVSFTQRLQWIALAACPSVLWLAMANTLSQSVAPVPLLWVLPLSLYLLSLAMAFEGHHWYTPAMFRIALPAAWLVMGYGLYWQNPAIGLKLHIAAFSLALFVCCLFCHVELARRKPKSAELTSFYLWVASGGVLGGVFVALAAPYLFDRFLELPIGVAGCVILAMRLLYHLSPSHVARLAVVSSAAMLLASQVNDWQEHTYLRRRNFYGSLQVSDIGSGDRASRVLSSGVVRHGSQFARPDLGRRPTAYYGSGSGVARAIRSLQDRPIRAALIGLGAGTLAAYARPGDVYRFYELNPQVIEIARSQFRYLDESAGQIEVVRGDGRLALAAEHSDPYDLVVLDAFSGDSIPTHLLTREAFALYFAHLRPEGIVAVHITSRYVNLEGVVRGAAAPRSAVVIQSTGDPAEDTLDASWVVIAPWAQSPSVATRIWTDDYSDLYGVLR